MAELTRRSRTGWRTRTAVAVFAALNTALMATPPAGATHPGLNGKIAFVRMERTDSGAQMDIYSMRPNGSGLRRLTADPANDSEPAWSADGTKIVFNSTRGGNTDIYVMDADGRNVRRLTYESSVEFHPEWTRDGRIVFNSDRDGNTDLYVMDADGQNTVRLTNTPGNDWLSAPSPTSDEIAFVSHREGDSEIYRMTLDGTNVRQLTHNLAHDALPSWSPDGNKIAFISERDYPQAPPLSFGPPSHGELYVMDADGGNQIRLTTTEQSEIVPSWAPEGNRIAFTRCTVLVIPLECSIVTSKPDGSQERVLQPGFQPDWQPLPPGA